MTSNLAQDAGIPLNLKGAYVSRITQNGPADKAGIHGSTTDQYLKKEKEVREEQGTTSF